MFTFRPLTSPNDFAQAVALQRSVWGADYGDLVPPAILHIVGYVGGVSAGAFTDRHELVGFIFGVSGVRDGRLSHWSDTLAVRADHRDRGIGEQLKRYQRELLLSLGIERMYWTFDPLESRNAHLNFNRLGATAGEYQRDFYGATNSGLHEDIGTDRLVVVWDMATPRVATLLEGSTQHAPSIHDHLHEIPIVNETTDGAFGPESGEPEVELDAARVRIAIPADIQALKARSPHVAREWRRVTRLAFEAYFARRYVACALVRRGAHSEYVLERDTTG